MSTLIEQQDELMFQSRQANEKQGAAMAELMAIAQRFASANYSQQDVFDLVAAAKTYRTAERNREAALQACTDFYNAHRLALHVEFLETRKPRQP